MGPEVTGLRTFPLYDPKIYSFTLIKEDNADILLKEVGRFCSGYKDLKLDIYRKEGWSIIELTMEIEPKKKGTYNVSADLIKVRFDELIRRRKALLEVIKPHMKTSGPHNYTLVTSGSHNNVWLRTFSDMSFLYDENEKVDKPDLLQSNITHLNRILRRSREVIINSLKHGKVDANLYMLGPAQGSFLRVFPEDLVLEVDLSDIRADSSYGDSPIMVTPSTPYEADSSEDKRAYQQRQNYLISLMALKSKLMDMFVLQSEFLSLTSQKIQDLYKRGKDLEEQIFGLQNSINEHMKVYVPKKKQKRSKEKDFLDRETFEIEKELLTTASVRFSMVSEVEHEIMRKSSMLGDILSGVRDVVRSLNLEISSLSFDGSSYSYGELTIKEVEQETRKLRSLMEELSHSRDILLSNIEVLRTFIDTRQREVSEDMSRLMNLLFLVFACIGLADALGNFVILVLERGYLGNDPSLNDVISYSALGMMLTLFPLLLAAIFLYWYFKRK
ncbi:MAG: hypothetical protein R6V01_02660 [Thermoplasmatota archaeon]